MLICFSHVQLCVTLWTTACQASLSMGSSRQEYQSGLPSPGDLHDPRIERASLNVYLHWQAGSLPLTPPGKGSLSTQVSLKLYTKKVLMLLRRATQAHS